MLVKMVPFVDLVGSEQELLIHEMKTASEVVSLLGELGGKKIWEED
jgi:hypothetical protein